MADPLPFAHSYNLARLGNAGDRVGFAADDDQRAALKAWSGVQAVEGFAVAVEIAKAGANRFKLDFSVTADVVQACVVTLGPVPAHLELKFTRELHFVGQIRHKAADSEIVLDSDPEEGPEDIESLHYDLAGPALEEFALALDPYPRAPGVEFAAPSEGSERPESPFAVLKGLKSGS
jgi:uncharacterized metal-binding protein YceD (DUF177 family)